MRIDEFALSLENRIETGDTPSEEEVEQAVEQLVNQLRGTLTLRKGASVSGRSVLDLMASEDLTQSFEVGVSDKVDAESMEGADGLSVLLDIDASLEGFSARVLEQLFPEAAASTQEDPSVSTTPKEPSSGATGLTTTEAKLAAIGTVDPTTGEMRSLSKAIDQSSAPLPGHLHELAETQPDIFQKIAQGDATQSDWFEMMDTDLHGDSTSGIELAHRLKRPELVARWISNSETAAKVRKVVELAEENQDMLPFVLAVLSYTGSTANEIQQLADSGRENKDGVDPAYADEAGEVVADFFEHYGELIDQLAGEVEQISEELDEGTANPEAQETVQTTAAHQRIERAGGLLEELSDAFGEDE